MTTHVIEVPSSQEEITRIHFDLQRGLSEVAALGVEQEALILNDDYYLQIAYQHGDLDKLRVFEKLFVAFRTEVHLVEAVIDILRDDLGYIEAAPIISDATVNAYRTVVNAFSGLDGIPVGAITRATVRAVQAPEHAEVLAVGIRNREFV